MGLRWTTRWLSVVAGVVIAACSNKMTLTSNSSSIDYTFKSFQDAATAGPFFDKAEISAAVKSELKDPLKIVSHLDRERVLFASEKGRSVIFSLRENNFKVVTSQLPVESKQGWTISTGQGHFWGVTEDKLFFKGSEMSDEDVIEDRLENVLDSKSTLLKPISASATDLIALAGKNLIWLSTVPQLKRELYLQLDSASLGNQSLDKITGGGVIAGRGVWLHIGEYMVYILQDSAKRYYPERTRIPTLKVQSGTVVPARISAFLESNLKSVINPVGSMLFMTASNIYITQSPVAATSADKPIEKTEQDEKPKGDQSSSPPLNEAPAMGPSLADLQALYTSKFKAVLDARCVGCHSGRPSKWSSFEAAKLFASDGSRRVEGGNMPQGGGMTPQERTELAKFLGDLASLP